MDDLENPADRFHAVLDIEAEKIRIASLHPDAQIDNNTPSPLAQQIARSDVYGFCYWT